MHDNGEYGPQFVGYGDFDDGLGLFGPNLVIGDADRDYFELLNWLNHDQREGVQEAAGILADLAQPSRGEEVSRELGGALVTFLNGKEMLEESETTRKDLDLFEKLADAAEDSYLDILKEACESGFAEHHPWVQRLISAMLFIDQTEAKKHSNSMLMNGAQNVFRAVNAYLSNHFGR